MKLGDVVGTTDGDYLGPGGHSWLMEKGMAGERWLDVGWVLALGSTQSGKVRLCATDNKATHYIVCRIQ